ncbi:MAG: MFS transporter [Ilumatobacter sp.]|uniref:MFS transporter n=1 Tax=Ilumatobacter sp. TaxID=1967498 RepID=UPI00262FD543|nr:MFS transporter [Ilumatobacter sp.]MDJ0771054.1 MFS transporter [Ilumatobacter sp.]
MIDDAALRVEDFQEEQRRTLNVLRLAVVPGQAAVAGSVAVVSLLASDLLGSDRLAGLGGAAFTLGAAVVAIPLAAFMRRRGRRPGLILALLAGALGAAVAATGGQLRWFPLFIVGMFLFGSGQAATLQARYVAADLAHEHDRARAIGAIVWIGTLGAVFGPVFTPLEKDVGEWLGLDEFIGPYLFAGALFLVGAIAYALLLRPDPLVLIGGTNPHASRARPIKQVHRSFGVIRSSPGAPLGIVAMAGSQAAMVGVMTMTPPHMEDHGHDDLSAMVIAVHILGMFGLAPLVGRFVDRVGAVRAIQYGTMVLASGTVSAVAAGYVPAMLFIGLFLLGLGWNLGLIAGTTLLTASVPQEARVEAQGTGDLTLSLCGAVAAFGSGFVKDAAGFHMLSNAATALAAAMLIYAWVTQMRLGRAGLSAAA